MDRQIRRHLVRRGIVLAHDRPANGLLGTESGVVAFLRWFHEDVMMFDSMEYRRQFWQEAYRRGHTIGHMPRTAIEFTDPQRHPYNEWFVHLMFLMVAMGVSVVVWWLVRTVDTYIRSLRRPTYYEVERARRLRLAEERRRIRRRRTISPCPTPDMLRTAFAQARLSNVRMLYFGSLLEDLECYVDNSVVWSGAEGRIVGRRGGIRQWLRENAPDLSEHYKTLMKYKALAKKFRQAIGVVDPTPATAVLPSDSLREETGDDKTRMREYCTEQIRGGRKSGNAKQGKERARPCRMPMRRLKPQEVASNRMYMRARELLGRCEGTMVSLSAQLALVVSTDFVQDENIARTKNEDTARKVGRPDRKFSAYRCGNK